MTASHQAQEIRQKRPATSGRLRRWLIALTLAAVLFSSFAVIFGFLINMDTKIEMNPRGDPIIRRDAIGLRIFAWTTVTIYVLLLAGGVVGGWTAYSRRLNRRSFGLSLMAAVPILLLIIGFLYAMMRGGQ
jgi:hypothetical protein